MLSDKQKAGLAIGRQPSGVRDACLALGRGHNRNADKTAAKLAGRKRYAGAPCPYGHAGERFVSTRGCVICTAAKALAAQRKNPQRGRELARAWSKAHPGRAYWRNPAAAYARTVKRRAAKIHRTPEWADDKQIAAYYKIAASLSDAMGRRYTVDHIIPLQGKRVSGLHVQNNLQILLHEDNCRKRNSFEGALSVF